MAFGGSLNAAGTSLTLTGVSDGATILVWPQTNSGNATAFSVSDDVQGSYAARGNIYGTSGDTNTQAFILTGAKANSHIITVGATGDTIFGLVAAWWTGYGDVDNALAAIHGAPVTSSTTGVDALNSGNITTTTAGCLIIGIAFDINNAATTLSAGTTPNAFTQRVLGNIGGAEPFILEDFTQSAAGVIAATAGTTASINAVTEVIALVPAGAVVAQGIVTAARGPGRSPGKNSARFQQLELSTVNPASGVTVSITGLSASFTAGTLTPASAIALGGVSASFSAGALSPAIAIAIIGQSANFTPGALVISSALALGGQSASFTAGAVSPSTAIALSGQSIVATPGALSPASSMAITGVSASFAPGSLSPALSVTLAGQSATFIPGTLTVPGDVTVSITGLTVTFTPGVMSAALVFAEKDTHDGGTQVVRASHYRKILRVKKKGPLQRQDLIDEEIAGLLAEKFAVLDKITDDDEVLSAYLITESHEIDQLTDIAAHLAAHLTSKH